MKTLRLLLLGILVLGCEQIVDDTSWPDYVEKGILHAEMVFTEDSIGVYCNLSRTASLGEPFDYFGTRIPDARILLTKDNEGHVLPGIPWNTDRGDFYNYGLTMPFSDAHEYSIRAEWEGKRLEGRVSIPRFPKTVVDTILISKRPGNSDWGYTGTFRLFVLPGFQYELYLYGIGWASFGGVTSDKDIPPEGKIVEDQWLLKKGLCRYLIVAYSAKYRDWTAPMVNADPFEAPRGNPKHNITGDGIGFFTQQFHGSLHAFDVQ